MGLIREDYCIADLRFHRWFPKIELDSDSQKSFDPDSKTLEEELCRSLKMWLRPLPVHNARISSDYTKKYFESRIHRSYLDKERRRRSNIAFITKRLQKCFAENME